jgi:UDP-N-acetylmuramate--alanine ligase
VTNIDSEHLDYYKDLEAIKSVFLAFLDRVPFYGLSVLCLDNEPIQDILPEIKKRFTTYGMASQADFTARNITIEGMKSRFTVLHQGIEIGRIVLNLPGRHNILNALASIAVGIELDIPFGVIKEALETLEGVQRRMEIKGEDKGITVVDDYGHHPTEIKSTLHALGECWPDRRKIVIFQPHRYSRTKALFDEFARSFYESDLLVILPIYAAGEKKIENIGGNALGKAIRAHGHKDVTFKNDLKETVLYLKEVLMEKDVVLTLGAGDVWRVGEDLLEMLKD